MKKRIKDKWIKALTSGKYRKCSEALKKGNNFCVLGVLSEIYRKETGKGEWIEPVGRFDNWSFKTKNGESNEILTSDVRKWAGLKSNNPLVKSSPEYGKAFLSELNDDGMSFKKLAEAIKDSL